MELAGLSLAEGAVAALEAKPCELGLGGRSLTGTDTGMTMGVRLSASGGSCGGGGGGRGGWGGGGGALSPSSYTDNKGFDPGPRAALTVGAHTWPFPKGAAATLAVKGTRHPSEEMAFLP